MVKPSQDEDVSNIYGNVFATNLLNKVKHALQRSCSPQLVTVCFTNAPCFLKIISKTSFIALPSGSTNQCCISFFRVLQCMPSFASLFYDVLFRFWNHLETCPSFPVSEHSATQTPLSHCVRSSDWVETRCFRSKAAQRPTHCWLRLRSKWWRFWNKAR